MNEDPGYTDDTNAGSGRSGARPTAPQRGTRRRRNGRRLWLAGGGMVVVAAAAVTGILKFGFRPDDGPPAHAFTIPARIGTYVRSVDLEREASLTALPDEITKTSAGQASHVVSAVYESGNSAAGGTAQVIMFIGGHLADADPASSVASFTRNFPAAMMVSAGPLGGQAACVESQSGTSDGVALCAWFDDDSFGELVSPTMNASELGHEVLTFRPAVEFVVTK
jgi:Microvirus J protein